MSEVDFTKVKPGVKVTLTDGAVGVVRGSFMSTSGLVLTVDTNPGSIVDRNVPIDKIVSIHIEGE